MKREDRGSIRLSRWRKVLPCGKGWRGGNKTLLMGERNALPPPGFDLGNSPLELSPSLLASRPAAVMATTNGTRALLKASAAGVPVYAVCARNAEATVRAALETGDRIGILCAGLHGRAALDDTACAGILVEHLVSSGAADLMDGAQMALSVWREGAQALFSSRAFCPRDASSFSRVRSRCRLRRENRRVNGRDQAV